MERNRFNLWRLMLLLLLTVACNNKSRETDYEEIIVRSYCYPDKIRTYDYYGERIQVNLIANNQTCYRKVYFHSAATDDSRLADALKDYPDTIYTQRSDPVRNFKIEILKDTLTAFYMPVGGGRMDIHKDVGTIFYYCEECSDDEKKEYGILLESEIFDTVFNNILHVRRCLHYSFFVKYVPFNPDSRWHIYYDVDRCIFVQVEHRTLDTNELFYISRVERVNKIDSSYFNRHWNNAESDCILMPMICSTHEL